MITGGWSLTGSRAQPSISAVGMFADGGQPPVFCGGRGRCQVKSQHRRFTEAFPSERQFTFPLAELILGDMGSLLDILPSTALKHGRPKITILLFGFKGSQQLPMVLKITATGFFPSAFNYIRC